MNEFLEILKNNLVEFLMLSLIPYLGVVVGRFLNQLKEESLSRGEGLKNMILEQLATTAVYAIEKQIKGKGKGSEKLEMAINYIYNNLPPKFKIEEDMIRYSIEQAFVKMEAELNLKGKKS